MPIHILAKLYCSLIIPTSLMLNYVSEQYHTQCTTEVSMLEEISVEFISWLLMKCASNTLYKLFERKPKFTRRVVAMDTEGSRGCTGIPGRVSLVFRNGYVYDKYVKPNIVVTDYVLWNGILPEDPRRGQDYETVREEVAHLIKGCILVGHDLKNDLTSLELWHPLEDIRDTALYMPFRRIVAQNHMELARKIKLNNMAYYDPVEVITSEVQAGKKANKIIREKQSLKTLAKVILKRSIQGGKHDSVEDARAALDLYLTVAKEWEAEFIKTLKTQ